MSGVLFVDPGYGGGARMVLVPADRTTAPTTVVAQSPFGALAQIESIANLGDVDRIVIDVAGAGLAMYDRLRSSTVVTTRDIALAPVNFAAGVLVP